VTPSRSSACASLVPCSPGRRAALVVGIAALVASALTGCPDGPPPPDGVVDAGVDDVTIIRFDAGPAADPVDDDVVDAGPVNSVVVVTSLTPANGPLVGSNRVIIEGDNFAPDSRAFFAGVEATNCLVLTARRFSCAVPAGAEAGPVDVRVENELGIGELEGGYTYFSPVTVTSLSPTVGSSDGGTAITLLGVSFNPEMIVLVGGRQVVGLLVDEDGTRATAVTPPGAAGRVDVVALDAFGRSTLPLAFTYEAPLTVDAVVPAIAAPGDVVEVRGRGFAARGGDETAVAVEGAAAARDNLIDDTRMRVVVPAVGAGSSDVAVSRGGDGATLVDGLVVLGPPTGTFAVTAAAPGRGDLDGGDVVTIVGEGFADAVDAVVGVTFGGVAAGAITVVDDRRLTATAPPGAPGAVDIVVIRTSGASATLAAGFVYFGALEVVGVAPPFTDVVGGTTITVNGNGFVDGVQVVIGGVACLDVVVSNPTQLSCTAPAGAAGPVDVVVTSPDGQVARGPGAFQFEDAPSVLGVSPARGGYTGDVVVTVIGTGFARLQRLATTTTPLLVLFGGVPGDPRELEVLSDNLLRCRTPLTATGVLDVTVGLVAVSVDANGTPTVTVDPAASAVATRAFTAFDPTSVLGGTRGGPIDGAVYVTALDAITGLPVPNMLAFTGSGGTPTAADITHFPFGQATLSGPDIVGPQTVSIVGDGYEHSTLVDVNASEITLYLTPLGGGGGGGGGGGEPPPPAEIRGRVFGFAKEFFDPAALGPDEIAVAFVSTTTRDEFSANPPPGGNPNVFEEGGDFHIANARPGRLALVALAGIFNLTTSEFRVRQMGIRREVFAQRGVTLVDQDIELTIPLDRVVDVALPDAPLDAEIEDIRAQFGNGPDITRVVPFLQLGGEGAFVYTNAIDGDRNHALDEMADVPGEMFTFVAGAYSTTGRNLTTDQGTASLGANSVVVQGSGTDWDATDFTGQPLVLGKIFVAELPDGGRFASDILGVVGQTLNLRDRAPVTARNVAYHIGEAGFPSSEVIQDGVGDLRGGVTIQPVLGIPDVVSPLENGVLEQRTLRWRPAPGQQPTIHTMYVYEPFDFAQVWSFYIDGTRTKVPVPVVPTVAEFLPVLPIAEQELPEEFIPPSDLYVGLLAWQHEAVFVPGLAYDSWSYLDIGARGRRAWTTNLRVFVHGRDD
jgi:hypothetical protein